MGKLFNEATTQFALHQAWRRIRENGYASSLEETRWATEQFDREANRNINKIQKRLRADKFAFDPQTGIAKKKAGGKGKRGIVMASVQNRVVERALLDTLQSKSTYVKNVINTPSSVGGVPERSVPHGLKMIVEAMKSGHRFFVRSDISGFFDNIPRQTVLDKIGQDVDDAVFMALLDNASTVTLHNAKQLGEDRAIFPTGYDGVAQGSPLSPLFGNILLHEFDLQLNRDGVICIRFIDDFVLLSASEARVTKAFRSAQRHLHAMGLSCHDPFASADINKAQRGDVASGFVFLGYDVRPDILQPSAKARAELLKVVRDRIKVGKREIVSVRRQPHADNSPRYVQTLVGIDRAVRGWGNAFAFANAPGTIAQVDENIEKELSSFRSWYAELVRADDWKTKRRTGGVCLLSDISAKSFADVPFRIETGGRFVQTAKTIMVSTDGAVNGSKRGGRDRGAGGWAYVIHDGAEGSGAAIDVTNNQMELQAVLEALKATPADRPLCIRTDSQHVQQIANGTNITKSNGDMWREFEALKKDRRVKIVWIKGHAGDPHNERADALAKQSALELAQRLKATGPPHQ